MQPPLISSPLTNELLVQRSAAPRKSVLCRKVKSTSQYSSPQKQQNIITTNTTFTELDDAQPTQVSSMDTLHSEDNDCSFVQQFNMEIPLQFRQSNSMTSRQHNHTSSTTTNNNNNLGSRLRLPSVQLMKNPTDSPEYLRRTSTKQTQTNQGEWLFSRTDSAQPLAITNTNTNESTQTNLRCQSASNQEPKYRSISSLSLPGNYLREQSCLQQNLAKQKYRARCERIKSVFSNTFESPQKGILDEKRRVEQEALHTKLNAQYYEYMQIYQTFPTQFNKKPQTAEGDKKSPYITRNTFLAQKGSFLQSIKNNSYSQASKGYKIEIYPTVQISKKHML